MATTGSTQASSESLFAALNAQYSSVGKAQASDANSASSIQNNFLRMLTAQLQNQDPLNPMDNAQITSQMAQLSTVTGIERMNASMQSLSDTIIASQTMSASSMLGRTVLVPGTTLDLEEGVAIGGLMLSQPADDVSVTVKDANGKDIATVSLGAQDAGLLPFAWDGKDDNGQVMPDGVYSFSVETSMKSGIETASATPLSYGVVHAVTPSLTGVALDVGSLGAIPLSDIKQVL